MSSVSSVGTSAVNYQPIARPASQTKSAATTTSAPVAHDPDRDGDTDGPGVDVNG